MREQLRANDRLFGMVDHGSIAERQFDAAADYSLCCTGTCSGNLKTRVTMSSSRRGSSRGA